MKLLKQQKPNLKRFWNYPADEEGSFKNGDVWLGAGWPYQTLQLKANNTPVKEIVPLPTTGGPTPGCSPSKAPHPNCAYKWMKYVTTPKVEAKQALVFGETPVNPKACPYMNKISKNSCTGYHLNEPRVVLQQDQVLEDADSPVRLDEETDLHGLQRLGPGVGAGNGVTLGG